MNTSKLILGTLLLGSGVTMLVTMPAYQRRVEDGKIKRDPSAPSFRTLKRVAIGLLIVGVLTLVDGFLNLTPDVFH